MNVGEANRVRACLDCGEPGALLWRTTEGENAGRLLRICAACLRKDDWHRFGLEQGVGGDAATFSPAACTAFFAATACSIFPATSVSVKGFV